jgi:site-specific DNA recombinase
MRNRGSAEKGPTSESSPMNFGQPSKRTVRPRHSRVRVKRLGGMTRTEASRRFLFSGLLRCGLCGGNMTITTTRPARYGCANHRSKSTCLNKVTISLDVLESEFLSSLTANLQDLDTREHLIQSLFEYLTANRTRLVGGADQQAKQKAELEEARQVLTKQQGNLVRAVRESGHSRALLSDLAEVEGRLSRITETLANMSAPPPTPIKKADVREFAESNAHAFLEILRGSPESLRNYLQQRITSITLTPDSLERGALYGVSGDVGIFSGDEGVLQSNQVDPIALHYTIPINFEFCIRAAGPMNAWWVQFSLP